MNKDINKTLAALVPVLNLNGEKVVSIEAVEDWYTSEEGNQEYCKEVAEITYANGYRLYADIGCDSNLTAAYDVLAVVQELKPKSRKIERIVREVYSDGPGETKTDHQSGEEIRKEAEDTLNNFRSKSQRLREIIHNM